MDSKCEECENIEGRKMNGSEGTINFSQKILFTEIYWVMVDGLVRHIILIYLLELQRE